VSRQKPPERQPIKKPGEWDDDEDRDSRTDRGMLGNLPTDDLTMRDLHGFERRPSTYRRANLACCMDVRKAGLDRRDIDGGPGSTKRLACPIPNLDREVVFRIVLGGKRIRRVGHARASVQRDLLKLAVEKPFASSLASRYETAAPAIPTMDSIAVIHSRPSSAASHDPAFTPSSRTADIADDLPVELLAAEWIKTSTALLSDLIRPAVEPLFELSPSTGSFRGVHQRSHQCELAPPAARHAFRDSSPRECPSRGHIARFMMDCASPLCRRRTALHPSNQLANGKRLGEVIVGALIEAWLRGRPARRGQ